MAGMDVFYNDKTGTLTLSRLTVDQSLIEVFSKNIDGHTVLLLAARASRLENRDNIDTTIINMLAEPKNFLFSFLASGTRKHHTLVHFLPFNPVEKRTTITYIDSEGNWHRSSKGAPEQIVTKVHAIIEKFVERGLRSLGVAFQ
ncbi:hypothetical protein MKX03_020056, partial [Papaver bracteatum]